MKIREKHALAVRWLHWINFPLLTIMIWSGLLIYWANDVYEVRLGSHVLFAFFPQWFYDFFNIPYRLAEGMAYHFVFMWLFFFNGLLYFLYLLISGQWRLLFPNRQSFKEGWHQVLYDLRIHKEEPKAIKYNGAQRIAYTGVLVMGFLMILTGLAIYKPIQLMGLTALFGGYEGARLVHFIITILFVLFFMVHIWQVIRAGWNNFRSMVSGYEVVEQEDLKTDEDDKS